MAKSENAPRHPNNSESDSALIIAGYDENDAYRSLAQQLSRQVEPTPEGPSGDDEDDKPGGILRRSNEFRTTLGPVMLESIALAGMEIAKANSRRARDLYRNKFPLLTAKFARICRECQLSWDDEEMEECPDCGAETDTPDEGQKAWAEDFFEQVNKEGQSLQQLYQALAEDAGRLGGWTHIVRYKYGVVNGATLQRPYELVRADSKRLKPVVDEDMRLGGYWWTCPIHRKEGQVTKDEYQNGNTRCPVCHAELREVFFAEVDQINRRYTSSDQAPEKLYFADEVIDFAAFNGRLSGHDWLAPSEHLWKRQAILEWMNTYAGAFFDDSNTNRYPGRLLILHTSNRSLVEKQLAEAKDERQQDPYGQGVLYNEIPREGGSTSDRAQVIDLMSEDLMGQSPELKKEFKSDIRGVYGQVDVQDSELEDAGGLNNEGLQLTVKNDAIASWQAELRDGPLSKLCRVLGITDWEIRFVPPEAPEEEADPEQVVNAVATAETAGIPYEVADGQFIIADTDGVVEPEPSPQPEAGGDGLPIGGEDITEQAQKLNLAREAVRRAVTNLEGDAALEGARWIGEAYDEMFAPGVEAEQQGDPMKNGHDMDPGTGRITCSETGEEWVIEDATWGDIAGECPHCGEELSYVEVESQLEQQVRAPVFKKEDDVPDFAKELLEDAILGGAIHKPEDLSPAEFSEMESVVRRNLVEEGNWTIGTIAQDLQHSIGVSDAMARVYSVNAVQNVCQSAIQLGYMVEGNLDEREFYLGGPHHPNICRACETLLFETNPSHVGGEPVPMDDLIDRIKEVAGDHGIEEQYVNGGQVHPNCLHRITEAR